MSYQVLARRWRPTDFESTVGQEHVLRALENALADGRIHHAYLFTGTRGVGKTSIARIVAKCLNCEQGVSARPCNECRACVEISEGRFVDLIEVDAASRTKVEDTRELLENVQYAPSRGRYKVYLIDEVHMLSQHSFNALLKTLEEPPPHVQFLLATTDPQKLPATVLSRCVQFHLRKLSAEQIVDHLTRVLREDQVEAEQDGLWSIARAADGSMRDALSLTDQAIALGNGAIRTADVDAMLGSTNRVQMRALVEALLDGEPPALLAAIAALSEQAVDYERVLADLLGLLHQLSVAKFSAEALAPELQDREQLIDWAGRCDAADLQLYYQIGVMGRRDFPYAPDPRGALEMILLRMLAFRPQQAAGTSEVGSAAAGEAAATAKKPRSAASRPATPAALQDPRLEAGASPPVPGVEVAEPDSPSTPPAAEPAPDPAPTPSAAVTAAEPAADGGPASGQWLALYSRLELRGVVAGIAANCVLDGIEDGCYCFTLDPAQASLYNAQCDERLALALERALGQPVTVRIQQGELRGESPAMRQAREAEERQRRAEQAIDADPNVRLLLERFSGTLHRDSIVAVEAATKGESNEGN